MKKHYLRNGLMSCLCTAALMLLGSGHAMACSPDDFSDIALNTWEESTVYYACTVGFPPETSTIFGKSNPVTRGEAAYILAKALGYSPSSRRDAFTDISNHTYGGYIQILAENEIISGFGGGSELYKPNDPLLRSAAASLIVKGFKISYQKTVSSTSFNDINKELSSNPSLWYAGMAQALYKSCICLGDDHNNFNGNNNIKRLEYASFIVRAKGYKDYCSGNKYYYSCTNGVWKSQSCSSSEVCNVVGKGCVECYYDTDCSGGYYCVSQKCVECKRNSDCGSGMTCSGGTCVECTGSGSQCKNNKIQVCSGGHWVDQTSCPMGCNSSGTACAECSGSGYQCEDNMEFICNNGVKSSMVSCGSLGCSSNNRCASCGNGDTKCDGQVYMACNNGDWSPMQTCTTQENCTLTGCVKKDEPCTGDVCLDASTLNECVSGVYQKRKCAQGQECKGNACVNPETPIECTESVCLTASVLKECVGGVYQQKVCDPEQECKGNACVPKDVDVECTESVCLNSSVLKECVGGVYQQKVCESECSNNACVESSGDKPDEKKCTEGDLSCEGSNLMICSSGKLVLKDACKNGCVDDSPSYCGECSENSCADDSTVEICENGKKKTVDCPKLSSCINGECQTDMKCKKAGETKCVKDDLDSSDKKGILICSDKLVYNYNECSGECKNGQCKSKDAGCSEGEKECVEESKSVYICSSKGKMVKQCSDDDECYAKHCSEDSKEDGGEPEDDDVNTGVISSGSCSQQSGHGAIGWLLLPVAALIYRRRRRMC